MVINPIANKTWLWFWLLTCLGFYTAMGITELAHFFFPFFSAEPYGYFPGMASVVILAPTGKQFLQMLE